MTEKLREEKRLKTYQMDRHGLLRPIMLMNELQAIADTHAEKLGCGRNYLVAHGIAWVVTHYLIDIIEMPTEDEVVNISTWPAAHDGLRATRDFQIQGADGRVMVNATSQWVLIDLTSRRLLRLTGNLPEWDIIPERALDRPFDKFPEFDATTTMDICTTFDNVDVNQHINNAVYVMWATESLGFDFRDTHKICGIDINFKREIAAGIPSVSILGARDGLTSRHAIRTDDTDHAVVVCHWKTV